MTNIEFASKVLLGALHHQTIGGPLHPIDYIRDCLETTFVNVAPGPEYDLIKKYCDQSSD